MASVKDRLDTCMIGVGGALPVLIGLEKRAPEWFYRLTQELKRLLK